MKKLGFIGGDIITCNVIAEYAKQGIFVGVCNLSLAQSIILEQLDEKQKANVKFYNDVDQFINDFNNIIAPMNFVDSRGNILSAFARKKINGKEFLGKLKGKRLLTSKLDYQSVSNLLKNDNAYVDFDQSIELHIYQAHCIAQGIINMTVEHTKECITGKNVFILGFGRVGKLVAKYFKALDANVACESRKPSDIAWTEALGYKSVKLEDLNDHLSECDVIINTIPSKVLTKDNLPLVRKDTLIIDISERPGVDINYAKEHGYNVKWALSLAQKYTPVTLTKIFKKTIDNIVF